MTLDGVVYVDQHGRWNYCGPANLTMALKFWGWPGDRDDVAAVVKPGILSDPSLDFIQRGKYDKNVMPYEMANFVTDHTDFNIVVRSGGDIELIKRLIASGFPVLIEKGYYEADYTGKIAWMGHYLFVTGYDDAAGSIYRAGRLPQAGQRHAERLLHLHRRLAFLQLPVHGGLPPRAGGRSLLAVGSLG